MIVFVRARMMETGAIGRLQLCRKHGGGRRCEREGCDKSAAGKTYLCVRHGGGTRCLANGCPNVIQGASFFCKIHGGGRRCIQSNVRFFGGDIYILWSLLEFCAQKYTPLCFFCFAIISVIKARKVPRFSVFVMVQDGNLGGRMCKVGNPRMKISRTRYMYFT
jgi:hypothetical protein